MTTTTTRVVHNENGSSYIICNSNQPFVNPTIPAEGTTTPEEILNDLNLDLGQTLIQPTNKALLWVIQFLDKICFQWYERVFFKLWTMVPLKVRRALTFGGWKLYFPLHKFLLGRKTGMHPSQSAEYHALTTLMWWGRLFPISPNRMRFSLSQLHVCTPNMIEAYRVETIHQIMKPTNDDDDYTLVIPSCQENHTTVRGLYLHQKDVPSEYMIFWVYGGAYLAGDALGNSSSADWIGKQTDMDVFCPDFRLAPEGNLDDVLWDVALAYHWLLKKRNKDPNKIFFLGISSGGAICLRLMQLLVEQQRGEETMPPYIPNLGARQPKGAVLFGPYIDYLKEKRGSFLHYPRVDLVVNQSVQHYGLPYLDGFIPNGQRKEYSPLYRNMDGLPPLCVVVSEHEAVYDMTMEMVNRARNQGVDVTVGVWKYMCHVFSFLWGFVPEGRHSMLFVSNWLNQQQYSSS